MVKFNHDHVQQKPLTEEEAKKQKFLTSFLKALYKYSDDEPDQFTATLGIAVAHITYLIDNTMVMEEYKDEEILRHLFLKNFEHAYEELKEQQKKEDEFKNKVANHLEELVSELEAETATKQ